MTIRGPIQSIQQATQVINQQQTQSISRNQGTLNQVPSSSTVSFDSVLKQKLLQNEEVKFSKHAAERLSQRNITLSETQLTKLSQGIDSAQAKGIKESLVLMDNIAMVVNVPNKTVITAIEKGEAAEHVFTNINGAVIL